MSAGLKEMEIASIDVSVLLVLYYQVLTRNCSICIRLGRANPPRKGSRTCYGRCAFDIRNDMEGHG